MDTDICGICESHIKEKGDGVTLRTKGYDGIVAASKQRGDSVADRIQEGQRVHKHCRKEYTEPSRIIAAKKRKYEECTAENIPVCRSEVSTFKFETQCMFCGYGDTYNLRKDKGHKLIPVRTFDFEKSIKAAAHIRSDNWSDKVLARINSVNDLPAADATYHQCCSVNFRNGKDIPRVFSSDQDKQPGRGRKKDFYQKEAFLSVMAELQDNDDEQYTIHDIMDKMDQYSSGENVAYSFTHMKNMIKAYFGDQVMITSVQGKSNVVVFTNTVTNIIHDFHKRNNQENTLSEKMTLVETAAKLIKCDIKSMSQAKEFYPSTNELIMEEATDYLPESLRLLLKLLFSGSNTNVKVASMGQAIAQATRPRSLLAPLQLGLGVQLHHQFGSRFLIDSLHEHGFCSSYAEVKRFERSSAVSGGTDITENNDGQFIQYIADNADHNTRTIDGKDTFHGMGMIASVTPGMKQIHKLVPRVNVTTEDITSIGHVSIKHFKPQGDNFRLLGYNALPPLHVDDPTSSVDSLWKGALSVRPKRPGWSGVMQMVQRGKHAGKASVFFLPMIDLNPSDMTCVYSTLNFICEHAMKYNVTPVLTFDQPLWFKALQVIQNQPADSHMHSIVLRLGGFHAQMSFLGSIGQTMAGSGLKEILELVYASNAVSHMLTGKAVERAVRGHSLVDASLNVILTTMAYKSNLQESTDITSNVTNISARAHEPDTGEPSALPDDLNKLGLLFDGLLAGTISVDDVNNDVVLMKFNEEIQKTKATLSVSRTSKLWLQYMSMVDILRRFIKAERLGIWELHLSALSEMLQYFAATGHNLYAKSVYLYLQQMSNLSQSHPNVHAHFQQGLHVIRRSDRLWAGLSSDLVIEQVLMKSMKSTGGLTRGRGMSEVQRLVWLMSRPVCLEVNNAMQELTSVSYSTSEQHKDITQSRQERDMKDSKEIITYLQAHNPFDLDDTTLRNIATGVTAGDKINADDAQAVGNKIILSMEGKRVCEYTFRKKDQLVNIESTNEVKIKDDIVHIDPQLLFQRLITAGTRNEELDSTFQYELCSYPPALFDDRNMMRVANKVALADCMWSLLPADTPTQPPDDEMQYVIDGGALLHRIPWDKGLTYGAICQMYIGYIHKYSPHVTIVFDGYAPSTKDAAHQRRSKQTPIGTSVHFTSDMTMNMKKDEFLANVENKQRFIYMLGEHLSANGCRVLHAGSDADVLIVLTAIQHATEATTVLIGDDTDLLLLLCHHMPDDIHDIYYKSENKGTTKKTPRCWKIKLVKKALGTDICSNILFVHAILGCDTTSRVYGLGKGVSLKNIKTQHFRDQAKVFDNANSTKNQVIKAGENALVSMYGGKSIDTLNELRLMRFCQKVGSSTSSVQPQKLPPTSSAASYHSLRVFHQVQEWKGNQLPPEDWGWKLINSQYVPIMTDKPVAPAHILEVVRCNCAKDCSSMRCTCRKSGMDCTLACGECRGICSNMTPVDEEDDEAV